jgi:hypothetical protein
MRVMLLIKGDPQPGAAPSEELLGAMGSYNDELKEAGVLIDLAGLLPSAMGRRVRLAGGSRSAIEGPFPESKQVVAGYWIPPGAVDGRGRPMGRAVPIPGVAPGSTRASTAPRSKSRSDRCSSRRGSTHRMTPGERVRRR